MSTNQNPNKSKVASELAKEFKAGVRSLEGCAVELLKIRGVGIYGAVRLLSEALELLEEPAEPVKPIEPAVTKKDFDQLLALVMFLNHQTELLEAATRRGTKDLDLLPLPDKLLDWIESHRGFRWQRFFTGKARGMRTGVEFGHVGGRE